MKNWTYCLDQNLFIIWRRSFMVSNYSFTTRFKPEGFIFHFLCIWRWSNLLDKGYPRIGQQIIMKALCKSDHICQLFALSWRSAFDRCTARKRRRQRNCASTWRMWRRCTRCRLFTWPGSNLSLNNFLGPSRSSNLHFVMLSVVTVSTFPIAYSTCDIG